MLQVHTKLWIVPNLGRVCKELHKNTATNALDQRDHSEHDCQKYYKLWIHRVAVMTCYDSHCYSTHVTALVLLGIICVMHLAFN